MYIVGTTRVVLGERDCVQYNVDYVRFYCGLCKDILYISGKLLSNKTKGISRYV